MKLVHITHRDRIPSLQRGIIQGTIPGEKIHPRNCCLGEPKSFKWSAASSSSSKKRGCYIGHLPAHMPGDRQTPYIDHDPESAIVAATVELEGFAEPIDLLFPTLRRQRKEIFLTNVVIRVLYEKNLLVDVINFLKGIDNMENVV